MRRMTYYNLEVSPFGLDNGKELTARARYMYGHVCVSDDTLDRVASVSADEAWKVIEAESDALVFVDSVEPWDVSFSWKETANTFDKQATYTLRAKSIITRDSHILIENLSWDRMVELAEEIDRSGAWVTSQIIHPVHSWNRYWEGDC